MPTCTRLLSKLATTAMTHTATKGEHDIPTNHYAVGTTQALSALDSFLLFLLLHGLLVWRRLFLLPLVRAPSTGPVRAFGVWQVHPNEEAHAGVSKCIWIFSLAHDEEAKARRAGSGEEKL